LGGLVQDSAGNLYGTTNNGGSFNSTNAGIVFELVRGGPDNWKFKKIYQFCAKSNCVDGAYPQGKLIIDMSGNLYGTTAEGGKVGEGEVFELLPEAGTTKWKLKVLYNFCCGHGSFVFTGLAYSGADSGIPYDGVSALYGTTQLGGKYEDGTVYELAPHNGKWYYKTLYSFCPQQHCPDGSYPSADLVVDAAGNLYGTASGAGLPSNGGTVFELSPTGNGWRETTLYSFCPQTGCPDGMFPSGSLTLDSSGDLLGVADGGGTAQSCPPGDIDGCGVIFRIKLNGANSSETVLYDFCQHQNCADGSFPNIGLTFGSPGKFFGVTALGGGKGADPNGGGTVFQLSYRTEKVLHSFCAEDNCADGQDPHARLIIDGSGNLFGITATGGNSTNSGTVFEITP